MRPKTTTSVIVSVWRAALYFSSDDHSTPPLPKETPMPHQFLSPEWMQAARSIREKYRDHAPKVGFVVRFNQVVTGVPFGEGVVHSHMDTSSGEVVMDLGHLERVDATLTTDYETARMIFVEQNPQKAMEAFLTGRVKVEGDMLKLMGMQAAMPQTEMSLVVAEEIRAITA
jgi:Zn-dependent metalloprotease